MTDAMGGDAARAQRLPRRMTAVLLTGHGGYDQLDVRDDVPVPVAGRARW
jgi:hypothetical protein